MTSGSCVKDTLQVPSEAKAPVQGSAAKAKAKLNSFFFENMTISSGSQSVRKNFRNRVVRGAGVSASVSAACPAYFESAPVTLAPNYAKTRKNRTWKSKFFYAGHRPRGTA